MIVTSPVFVETLLAFKTLTFAAAWAGWALSAKNMTEITATAFFIYSPIVFDCLWKTVKASTGARILNLCELCRVLGVKTNFYY